MGGSAEEQAATKTAAVETATVTEVVAVVEEDGLDRGGTRPGSERDQGAGGREKRRILSGAVNTKNQMLQDDDWWVLYNLYNN